MKVFGLAFLVVLISMNVFAANSPQDQDCIFKTKTLVRLSQITLDSRNRTNDPEVIRGIAEIISASTLGLDPSCNGRPVSLPEIRGLQVKLETKPEIAFGIVNELRGFFLGLHATDSDIDFFCRDDKSGLRAFDEVKQLSCEQL